ncbi:MAG: DUF1015 domain-containing protein [Planctomycetes bacterium]|nr:DUF1015 domain-containing protein [Planctomycetota bacterium]
MASIHPFRAWRYDPAKVADLSRVVAQPYDKIDEPLRLTYLARHPRNAVRLIQSREDPVRPGVTRYRIAAETFAAWRADGTFTQHPDAAVYPSAVQYKDAALRERTRRALTVLLSLDAPGAGVRAHERTLEGPKADRLNLLREMRAHAGQIFMLYDDPECRVEAALEGRTEVPPLLSAQDDDGCSHRVWAVSEPRIIDAIRDALRDRMLMIADGHHRYETALAYRSEQRATGRSEGPHDRVLVTLVNMKDEGLTIFPTHRLVHSVKGWDASALRRRLAELFDMREAPADADAALSTLPKGKPGFVLALPSGQGAALWTCSLKAGVDPVARIAGDSPAAIKRLDVSVLHQMVLEPLLGIDAGALAAESNVHYRRHAAQTLREVAGGKVQGAFLLRPTPIEAVRDCALAGARMPQKSTDFYPKLLSGLLVYSLDAP